MALMECFLYSAVYLILSLSLLWVRIIHGLLRTVRSGEVRELPKVTHLADMGFMPHMPDSFFLLDLCFLRTPGSIESKTTNAGGGRGGWNREEGRLEDERQTSTSYDLPSTEPLWSSASFYIIIWTIWSCYEEFVRSCIWGLWLNKWKVLVKTASMDSFGLIMNRVSL